MNSTEKRCVLRAAGRGSLVEIGARVFCALVLYAVPGCAPDVVTWEHARAINGPQAHDARLTLTAGSAVYVPNVVPATVVPPEAGCPGSMRVARGEGLSMYAVWWSVRENGNSALVGVRSDDGGATWTKLVPVDTSDVGGLGCSMLPPAIAVDPATGYVHVVYSLKNTSGSGVFFSHSMERGALYHAPVAIVYGDRMSTADVAASASRVVVAYEDPNRGESSSGKIAIAISRTNGHIFEHRVPVTSGGASVGNPHVALNGDRIAVSWAEAGGSDTTPRWMVRVGKLN